MERDSLSSPFHGSTNMKIGVVLLLMELPGLERAYHWRELARMAGRCEELGFDSLWLYDHLLYRERGRTIGIWEGWSMLSALAAVTNKAELGTLVACNSFRNPALLAKMAHTVDEISGGRLILGLGAGWNQPEYDAFGYPFDHRVSRFEEALQIIRPLLKTGQVDFAGRYYTVRDCEIAPRSPRPGGPPLWIGAAAPRMLRLTAQYADGWNTCYTSIPRSAESRLKAMRRACKQTGRDPADLAFSYTVSLAYPEWLGWAKEKKRGYLTGSVEELAATLHEYAAMGADHLMFHIAPLRPETLELLAQSVALYRNNHS